MRAGADFVLTAAAISFLRRYCFELTKQYLALILIVHQDLIDKYHKV
jgi:hypothetical protein